MIHFRCQCGLGQSVQESVAPEVADCYGCGAPLKLVWSGPLGMDEHFNGRLVLRAALEDSPIEPGAQVLLGGAGPVEVGKDESNAIRLPGKAVSRSHCRLAPAGAGWRVEDLGSTNGCYVNGERVQTRELVDGDVLRVGFYELVYHAGTGKAAPAAPKVAPREFEPEAPATAAADPAWLRLAAEQPAAARPKPPPSPHPAAKAPPAPAVDVPEWRIGDVYEPEVGERRGTPRTAPHAPRPDDARQQLATAGPPVVCPSCTRKLPPGTKVCVACGINVETGRQILIARELDEQTLETGAHETLKAVSIVLWFGFFPIASEAYGSKRPYVVWAIALLTAVTTLAVWVHDRGEGADLSDTLAHWTGTLTAAHVRAYYEHPDLESYPQQIAYQERKQARKGTVPDEELPLAAYHALPPEHQVFGRPRWYQLFTHTLLHVDLVHLASNLVFLLVFGSRVNALIGQWKIALLYPLLGALSGWVEAVATSSRAPVAGVGASGAIAGLAGMYLVLFPLHRVFCVAWVRGGLFTVFYKVFAVRGFWVVVFFAAWDALFLIATDEYDVAHWSHLGGFAVGFVLAMALLIARGADALGGDLLSALLGRRAWALIGKPGRRRRVGSVT